VYNCDKCLIQLYQIHTPTQVEVSVSLRKKDIDYPTQRLEDLVDIKVAFQLPNGLENVDWEELEYFLEENFEDTSEIYLEEIEKLVDEAWDIIEETIEGIAGEYKTKPMIWTKYLVTEEKFEPLYREHIVIVYTLNKSETLAVAVIHKEMTEEDYTKSLLVCNQCGVLRPAIVVCQTIISREIPINVPIANITDMSESVQEADLLCDNCWTKINRDQIYIKGEEGNYYSLESHTPLEENLDALTELI